MTTNKLILEAIKKINPNAEVSLSNADLDTLQWNDNTTPISKEDIEAQIPVVEQELADGETAKENLKASAKAKLIAGEALTEDEANTIVL